MTGKYNTILLLWGSFWDQWASGIGFGLLPLCYVGMQPVDVIVGRCTNYSDVIPLDQTGSYQVVWFVSIVCPAVKV
jgi:hypothetical protein